MKRRVYYMPVEYKVKGVIPIYKDTLEEAEDEILEGDHVLIVTKHKSFDDIDDILK